MNKKEIFKKILGIFIYSDIIVLIFFIFAMVGVMLKDNMLFKIMAMFFIYRIYLDLKSEIKGVK